MKLLRLTGQAAIIATIAAAFVLGSAGISEAAKKKGAKARSASTGICTLQPRAPVCAVKGKMRFTYANSCFAAADGAKVSAWKACKATKAKKSKKKAMKKK